MHWCGILVIGVIFIATLIYLFFKNNYRYFKRRGIPFDEPVFPYGNLNEVGTIIPISSFIKGIYDQFKGKCKVGGMFIFFRPVLLVLDIDLVKNILIKDFNNFVDRGMYYNEADDPISAHLFAIEAKKWRILRSKLSPAFTSGKMKFMFPTIVKLSERLRECITDMISNDYAVIEIHEIASRFTTDVVGTCGFGIECNSLKDPNAEFYNLAHLAFENPRHSALLQVFLVTCQSFANFLGIKAIRDDVGGFFSNILLETIKYREKNNIQRNDFMDILIKLKNQETQNITINEIVAQGYLFFLASYETSSTTLTFSLYELALNPDVQEKTRKEIRSILKKYDGQYTYEALSELVMVGQVIHGKCKQTIRLKVVPLQSNFRTVFKIETLRMYPPAVVLTREAMQDYTIPDTKHVIEKGTLCFIPTHAIHHDPEYYPEPEKFKPERFTAAEIAKRDVVKWLPFGEGPRNCIGLRFAMMQIRMSLAILLDNFEFSITEKTVIPVTFVPKNFILTPDCGIYLGIKNIKC